MAGTMSNENLVQQRKGLIDAASTLASSGALLPEQADRFIDFVFDRTVLSKMMRTERFRNDQLHIEKLGIGNRVTVPADEGVDPGHRVGVNTGRVTLTPKELITPFDISDRFLESNVEGQSAADRVIRMMSTQFANDTEEMVINADTRGPVIKQSDLPGGGDSSRYVLDRLMALFDGALRLADSGHLVDAQGAAIGASVFSEAYRAMPDKFRRSINDLVWITSLDMVQLWKERVAARATPAGDQALTSKDAPTPWGIPLLGVPLFPLNAPVTEHVTLNTTVATSLRYSGLVAGSAGVVPTTITGTVPVTPFSASADFLFDAVNGTLARRGGSAIGDGATVKVTYKASPQLLLTHVRNLIFAIGRDVRLERARNIHKRANEFVLTTRVSVNIEEVDALVKVYNLSSSI
jgi:hypothetical protein